MLGLLARLQQQRGVVEGKADDLGGVAGVGFQSAGSACMLAAASAAQLLHAGAVPAGQVNWPPGFGRGRPAPSYTAHLAATQPHLLHPADDVGVADAGGLQQRQAVVLRHLYDVLNLWRGAGGWGA